MRYWSPGFSPGGTMPVQSAAVWAAGGVKLLAASEKKLRSVLFPG